MTGRVRALVAALALALVTAVVGGTLQVDYLALQPGAVFDTLGTTTGGREVISVASTSSQYRVYPTSGHLFETTVQLTDRLHLPDLVVDWISSDDAVVPYDVIYPPDKPVQQVQQQSQQDMQTSQQTAMIVALAHLKIGLASRIDKVLPGSPATDELREGDLVTSLDGVAIGDPTSFTTEVKKHHPGETLRLGVVRAGAPLTVPVVAGNDGQGRALLGVESTVAPPAGLTIQFGISPEEVGGPSAGLMMTLAIIDHLTSDDLTGGATIAGTGTIATSGDVGPIGGIQQKMIAARRAGATAFLVPAGNCDEARRAVPDGLRLAKVTSLTDALSDLADLRAHRDPPTC